VKDVAGDDNDGEGFAIAGFVVGFLALALAIIAMVVALKASKTSMNNCLKPGQGHVTLEEGAI